MSTILAKTAVPFDGGDAAELAISTIAPLIQTVGGEVHVIMVLDQHVENQLAEFADAEKMTIGQAAENSCGRLKTVATGHGLDITYEIVTGAEVVDGLISAARAAGCTAIALPTHGFKGVTRWLMGNLRDKIVQAAQLPVLVLPPAT